MSRIHIQRSVAFAVGGAITAAAVGVGVAVAAQGRPASSPTVVTTTGATGGPTAPGGATSDTDTDDVPMPTGTETPGGAAPQSGPTPELEDEPGDVEGQQDPQDADDKGDVEGQHDKQEADDKGDVEGPQDVDHDDAGDQGEAGSDG